MTNRSIHNQLYGIRKYFLEQEQLEPLKLHIIVQNNLVLPSLPLRLKFVLLLTYFLHLLRKRQEREDLPSAYLRASMSVFPHKADDNI